MNSRENIPPTGSGMILNNASSVPDNLVDTPPLPYIDQAALGLLADAHGGVERLQVFIAHQGQGCQTETTVVDVWQVAGEFAKTAEGEMSRLFQQPTAERRDRGEMGVIEELWLVTR